MEIVSFGIVYLDEIELEDGNKIVKFGGSAFNFSLGARSFSKEIEIKLLTPVKNEILEFIEEKYNIEVISLGNCSLDKIKYKYLNGKPIKSYNLSFCSFENSLEKLRNLKNADAIGFFGFGRMKEKEIAFLKKYLKSDEIASTNIYEWRILKNLNFLTYISFNRFELEKLGYNLNNLENIAKDISKKTGIEKISLHLDISGAAIFKNNEFYYFRPLKIFPYEVIGAGDFLDGYFIACYSKKKELKECFKEAVNFTVNNYVSKMGYI